MSEVPIGCINNGFRPLVGDVPHIDLDDVLVVENGAIVCLFFEREERANILLRSARALIHIIHITNY